MHNILLLGGVIYDKILTIDTYPAPGSDTLITSEKIIPAGCALNTAVTMKSFGMNPYVVGMIGREDDAEIIQYMQQLHLSTDAIHMTDKGNAGYCITMVDPAAERTFFTMKGVEYLFDEQMIPQDVNFSSIYLTGYFLLEHKQAVTILNYLSTCDIPIFLDPGVLISKLDRDLLQQLLSLCYAITPNEQEYELLQGFDINSIPLIIQKRGKGNITAKQGKEIYSCFPYDVKTIDTTGAGDCFVGALMSELLKKKTLSASLKTAVAAASFMTTVQGPHTLFNLKEIRKIEEHTRELRL